MYPLKILSFFIPLLAIASEIHGKRNFGMTLDYCNTTINPNYIKSCFCYIDKSFDPPRAFLDSQLNREIAEMFFDFDVVVLKKNNETLTLFNATNIDGCKFLEGSIDFTLLKIFRDVLLHYGQIPEKCPIDKNFHFVFNNVSLDPERFPPYVPEARFIIHIKARQKNDVIVLLEACGDIKQKRQKWIG